MKLADIAQMIDHALLHPTLTDTDFRAGLLVAQTHSVAAVCVQPFRIAEAADFLASSGVKVCTVVGFPQGSNTLGIKLAETRQAIQEGATEIDFVVNIGKVLSGDWAYVAREIAELSNLCRSNGAICKVIFENDYLPDNDTKIKLIEVCNQADVDFIKTSTGFGYKTLPNHTTGYEGATEADIRLMRQHALPHIQLKASGGIRTLDDVLKFKALGCRRIGTSSTEKIIKEAAVRLG